MSDPQDLSTAGRGMSRRTVVRIALIGAAGAAAGAGSVHLVSRLARSQGPAYRFFSEAEASLLVDICEQIIPGDDAPGATQTGAVRYIDRQLCGPLSGHRRTYRSGLESFRLTCLRSYKAPFGTLAPAEKIGALEALESGRVPADLWGEPSASAFFGAVLAHTMQSFYGSPRHGGNLGYASYRMLGLDYPQVVGQNRYGRAPS
jgi:gluconate 2-dehydrogenase gamma chain